MTAGSFDFKNDRIGGFAAVEIVDANRVAAFRRELCRGRTDSAAASGNDDDGRLAHSYSL